MSFPESTRCCWIPLWSDDPESRYKSFIQSTIIKKLNENHPSVLDLIYVPLTSTGYTYSFFWKAANDLPVPTMICQSPESLYIALSIVTAQNVPDIVIFNLPLSALICYNIGMEYE